MPRRVIVAVKEGIISGIKKQSLFSKSEYYSFLGVPYGEPPVGQSRFQDPVKVKPWKGTLDTSAEKQGCRQFSQRLQKLAGSEDCLYNNIHIPQLPSKDRSPKKVIFNIHMGGYLQGSPDPWCYGSPEYIMHHDIVYVCVSFRLHILGFLNLGLKECSGNQGLKDIIMSLEWIKENIAAFGGDPNDITIMGSSSGSSIIHSLLLSPRGRGLYHKAIMMGYYNFNPTGIFYEENANLALGLAKSLGYKETDDNDNRKLLSFYKDEVSIDDVIRNHKKFASSLESVEIFPNPMFLPARDHGPNAILPQSNEKLIKSMNRVPLLIGFCDKEAVLGFTKKYKNKTMKNFYSTVRLNISGWGRNLNDDQIKYLQEQVELFYANRGTLETMSLSLRSKIQTDMSLSDLYDSLVNVVDAALPSSVYVYKFDFEGNACKTKDILHQMLGEPLEGSTHGTDYSYWAFMHEVEIDSLTPKTKQMIDTFTKFIITFAKTNNPNYDGIPVEWKPTTVENPCYLRIDDRLDLIEGKLNGNRMEFWENLKRKLLMSYPRILTPGIFFILYGYMKAKNFCGQNLITEWRFGPAFMRKNALIKNPLKLVDK